MKGPRGAETPEYLTSPDEVPICVLNTSDPWWLGDMIDWDSRERFCRCCERNKA